MKKYSTLIIVLFMMALQSLGQCIPNPAYTHSGIYPDSATGLPPAVATYEYNAVFTAVIPADTIVPPLPQLNIDSIGVAQITGLPEGFQAIPSRPSGYWLGGTSGCMLITGTPTEAQVGVYPLNITVVGYLGGLGLPFPYEITYYSITILPASAYGIEEQGSNDNIRMKVFPNPFTGLFLLDYYTEESGSYECLIYDAMGRLLQSEIIVSAKGQNSRSINGSNLEPGIYFCRLRYPEKNFSATVRLIKR